MEDRGGGGGGSGSTSRSSRRSTNQNSAKLFPWPCERFKVGFKVHQRSFASSSLSLSPPFRMGDGRQWSWAVQVSRG